jgi:hypothetical protein
MDRLGSGRPGKHTLTARQEWVYFSGWRGVSRRRLFGRGWAAGLLSEMIQGLARNLAVGIKPQAGFERFDTLGITR